MRGIQLARYGEKLCVKNINLPLLNNSEKCLVKIHYAPVNPSDAYYVKGLYGMKKALPTIGGFEGCGVIEEANDTDFIGKKVMCWIDDDDSSGTWADYCVVKRKNLIILDEGLPYLNDNFASYCSPFINPVTAICFLDIAKKNNSQSVIINAANSAVARMTIKLFKKENIQTLAIIRNKDQVQNIYDIGASHVLLSSNENYKEELISSIKNYQVKTFYDALGGDDSSVIFKNLINSGILIGYGRFSNNRINDIDPLDLVFRQKQIKGFWLPKWLESQSCDDISQIKYKVKNEITTTLSTRIHQIIKPTDNNINDLIRQSLTNTSQGKYVLDFTK